MLTSFRLILYNQSVKIFYIISNLKCQSFSRKKYQPFFVSILKNYRKLNFFSSIWVSIWVSIWISNMIRIETAILSLNEVSMDFKLENRKSGQISLLHIPFTVLCGPSNRFFNYGLKGPFFTPKDQIPTSHFVLEPLGAPNWCVNLWLLRKIWLVLQKNSVFIL